MSQTHEWQKEVINLGEYVLGRRSCGWLLKKTAATLTTLVCVDRGAFLGGVYR